MNDFEVMLISPADEPQQFVELWDGGELLADLRAAGNGKFTLRVVAPSKSRYRTLDYDDLIGALARMKQLLTE